jgi:hypothetical protein
MSPGFIKPASGVGILNERGWRYPIEQRTILKKAAARTPQFTALYPQLIRPLI